MFKGLFGGSFGMLGLAGELGPPVLILEGTTGTTTGMKVS